MNSTDHVTLLDIIGSIIILTSIGVFMILPSIKPERFPLIVLKWFLNGKTYHRALEEWRNCFLALDSEPSSNSCTLCLQASILDDVNSRRGSMMWKILVKIMIPFLCFFTWRGLLKRSLKIMSIHSIVIRWWPTSVIYCRWYGRKQQTGTNDAQLHCSNGLIHWHGQSR